MWCLSYWFPFAHVSACGRQTATEITGISNQMFGCWLAVAMRSTATSGRAFHSGRADGVALAYETKSNMQCRENGIDPWPLDRDAADVPPVLTSPSSIALHETHQIRRPGRRTTSAAGYLAIPDPAFQAGSRSLKSSRRSSCCNSHSWRCNAW
jgi:hypothetical protein